MSQSREQATVGKIHASISVGRRALPPQPLILKWLHPSLSLSLPTPITTTTTQSSPGSPVSSTVCGDEVSESQTFCCLVCITFYDHIFFPPNNPFFVMLHCLCMSSYKAEIRYKILPSCIFIQFCPDKQGTKLC